VYKETQTGAEVLSLAATCPPDKGIVVILHPTEFTPNIDDLAKYTFKLSPEAQASVVHWENLPKTPSEFYSALDRSVAVQLMNYSDLRPLRSLRITTFMSFSHLRSLIQRTLFPNLDGAVDQLLIFGPRGSSLYPDSSPLFGVPSSPKRLFIHVVPKSVAPEGCVTIVVPFSENGYRISTTRAFFQKTPFDLTDIEKQLGDLILGRRVRFLAIKNGTIIGPFVAKSFISSDIPESIRCDVIPHAQENLADSDLVPIVHVKVSDPGLVQPTGTPFMVPALHNDTVQIVRGRIQEGFGKTTAEMSRVRLFVGYLNGSFDPKQVLKSDEVLRKRLTSSTNLLLVQGSKPPSPVRISSTGIKIHN
jgi:hypothetical protein